MLEPVCRQHVVMPNRGTESDATHLNFQVLANVSVNRFLHRGWAPDGRRIRRQTDLPTRKTVLHAFTRLIVGEPVVKNASRSGVRTNSTHSPIWYRARILTARTGSHHLARHRALCLRRRQFGPSPMCERASL